MGVSPARMFLKLSRFQKEAGELLSKSRYEMSEKRIPRLHLSTAFILFLMGSVLLGMQFVQTGTSSGFRISFSSHGPHVPAENEGDFVKKDFGFPFTLYTKEEIAPGNRVINSWFSFGIAANSALMSIALLTTAYILERRIRHRTALKLSPDKV